MHIFINIIKRTKTIHVGQNEQLRLGQSGQMVLTYGAWWGYGVVFVASIMITGTASKHSIL